MARTGRPSNSRARWAWLAEGIESITSDFLPQDTSHLQQDQLRRLRTGVRILLIATALIGIGLLVEPFRSMRPIYFLKNGAAEAVCVLLLLGSRRGLSAAAIGHGLSCILYAGTLLELFSEPTLQPSSCMALISTPVMVTLLVGIRGGWLWCGVSVTILMVAAGQFTEPWARSMVFSGSLTAVGLTGVTHAFDSQRRKVTRSLLAARDEARAATVTKSRFLANMSHEIRTPMNGVLGMLGLLLDGPLPKQQRAFARTAHGSGMALLDLINDILDFSKIEAGQMILEAVSFDLRALVEDVLDQMSVLVMDKDVELVARYVPGTPTHVLGDHGRVRQIVLNLVSNAVKFTERGHVLVTVEHRDATDDTAFVISVEDTGIGIPQAQQVSIFEEFRQADDTTTRAHGGTGLGLAIVRDLVKLMNGELGVTSTPGEGSTFWLSVPLPTTGRESLDAQGQLPRELLGTRVLVVDDHPVSRRVVRELLSHWGLEPAECASGAEALTELARAHEQQAPYPLVVVDHPMPGMDGVELAARIETHDELRDTALVLLNSVSDQEASQQAREAGFSASLTKPIHQTALMDALVEAWTHDEPNAPTKPGADPKRASAGPKVDERFDHRVLIVEDNPVNQKVARTMLTSMGCRVDVAGDGLEALMLIDSAPYDVVFMDVQMPRMDGLEATRELRRREQSDESRLLVIAMTAHAMPEDRDRCLDAGMDGYLSKPMQRRDFLRILREHAPTAQPALTSTPDPRTNSQPKPQSARAAGSPPDPGQPTP